MANQYQIENQLKAMVSEQARGMAVGGIGYAGVDNGYAALSRRRLALNVAELLRQTDREHRDEVMAEAMRTVEFCDAADDRAREAAIAEQAKYLPTA